MASNNTKENWNILSWEVVAYINTYYYILYQTCAIDYQTVVPLLFQIKYDTYKMMMMMLAKDFLLYFTAHYRPSIWFQVYPIRVHQYWCSSEKEKSSIVQQ